MPLIPIRHGSDHRVWLGMCLGCACDVLGLPAGLDSPDASGKNHAKIMLNAC